MYKYNLYIKSQNNKTHFNIYLNIFYKILSLYSITNQLKNAKLQIITSWLTQIIILSYQDMQYLDIEFQHGIEKYGINKFEN